MLELTQQEPKTELHSTGYVPNLAVKQ